MRHNNWFGIETKEAEFPSTFSVHQPEGRWRDGQKQMAGLSITPKQGPPSTTCGDQPAQQPLLQPRKHISQAPPPIKISKHLFQDPPPAPFPSTNPSLARPATSHATLQAHFPSTPTHQKFRSTFPKLPTWPLFQAAFSSTNPSPAHPATSHAISQAHFPSSPAHQNLQALFPSGRVPSRVPNQKPNFFLGHATFGPLLRIAPCDFQPPLKKVLRYCQRTKYFMPRGFAAHVSHQGDGDD